MSRSILDLLVQEEADRLQEERGFFDPDVLERRIAQRIASMSEEEFGALRNRSASGRIQRRVRNRLSERVRGKR